MCKKSIPVVLAGVAMQCDAMRVEGNDATVIPVTGSKKNNDDLVTVTLHKTGGSCCLTGSTGCGGRHVRFDFPRSQATEESTNVKSRFEERIRDYQDWVDGLEKKTKAEELRTELDHHNGHLSQLVGESEKNRYAQFSRKHRNDLEKVLGEKYWEKYLVKNISSTTKISSMEQISSMEELSSVLGEKLVKSGSSFAKLQCRKMIRLASAELKKNDLLRVKLIMDNNKNKLAARCDIVGMLVGMGEGGTIPVVGNATSYQASQQCVFKELISAMGVFNKKRPFEMSSNVWSTITSSLTGGEHLAKFSKNNVEGVAANCVDFSDFVVTRIRECSEDERRAAGLPRSCVQQNSSRTE